jgi:hypothetical protein
LGKTLLLVDDLVLHLVLGLDFELLVVALLLILALNYFGLLGLFLLRKVDRLLHFSFFLLPLLVYHVVLG